MSNARKPKPEMGRWAIGYIAVENGTTVEMTQNTFERSSSQHHILGYQPAPIGPRQAVASYKPHGWLVVLIRDGESATVPAPRKVRSGEGHGRVTNRRLDMRLRENRNRTVAA